MSSFEGSPDLVAEVRAAMAASVAPTESVHLYNGIAQATIRIQGGYITRLVLEGEHGPDNVLYSPPDPSLPKPPASHLMMPVGPWGGLGGQHGFLRWVRHEPRTGHETIPGWTSGRMFDPPPSDYPVVERSVFLERTSLTLGMKLSNQGSRGMSTSIGERLYFDMPEGSAADILLNGESMNKVAGRRAWQNVDRGTARHWRNPGGRVEVTMPDGRKRRILMHVATVAGVQVSDDYENTIGMLLWRRPGQPYICLEPTVGYKAGGKNANLHLWPRGSVVLSTGIRV